MRYEQKLVFDFWQKIVKMRFFPRKSVSPRSVTFPLLVLLSRLLEEGWKVGLTQVDLRAAFDSLQHSKILDRLRSRGIPEDLSARRKIVQIAV